MVKTKKDQRNERTAMTAAIALHCIVFILAGIGFFSCESEMDIAGSDVSIVFGSVDVGGNSSEPAAQEEVVEEEVEPVEEQSDPVEDVSAVDPDTDSELAATDIPKPINKPSENKPVNPNKPLTKPISPVEKPKKPAIDASTLMGSDSGGKGESNKSGDEGKKEGKDNVNKHGGGGTSGLDGKGPSLSGWKLDDQLEQPEISAVGIAEIRFTINNKGYVVDAKVIKGPFTAAQKKKIEDKVMRATFSALNGNAKLQTRTSGIYKWEFTF